MSASAPASYDPDDAAGGFGAELQRLESQAALSWPAEELWLRRFGFGGPMRILDAGAGPGCVSRRVRQSFPEASVIALDTDLRLLAHAGGARVCADMGTSAFAPASFHAVLTRYVWQHLAEPSRAAAEMLCLLRPGGKHVVVDIDDDMWGMVEPSFAQLRAIWARLTGAQAARGGNRRVGRALWRILRDAGYVNVELQMIVIHSDERGITPFLPALDPDRLLPRVEDGSLPFEEYAAAHALHRAFLHSRRPFVLHAAFIACGERPE